MCISNRAAFGHARSGFTLVELVMFIVIVGIAVVGVLMVLNATTKSSGDPQLRKQALSIAEALLEEVELARFTYCYPSDPNAETAAGTGACTTVQTVGLGKTLGDARPYYNVNDYVTAYGVAQPAFNVGSNLTDAAGNAMVATGNYTATLTITPVTLDVITSNATPATTNVLLITVVVSYGNGNSVRLDGYRTRYAPNSIP